MAGLLWPFNLVHPSGLVKRAGKKMAVANEGGLRRTPVDG